METYLAINPRTGSVFDVPPEVLLWGSVFVAIPAGAFILAANAIEWYRNKKNPQREDEVWR